MPIYEYDCQQCGARIELLRRASDDAPTCTECSSSNLKKRISAAAIGSGAPDTPCGRAPCSQQQGSPQPDCSSGICCGG
ncbi:MAG: zinc ribbon domain-containing protein [Mariprofundales bacterium]|nr:zinc ribbon domain-containing protein [Mariprofundales bacterium]